MLKRTIFLLSYFAFFVLVPIVVYSFWPVSETLSDIASASTGYLDSADMEIDSAFAEYEAELQRELEDFEKDMILLIQGINMIRTVLYCLITSVIFTFLLAFQKFRKPEKKLGGVTLGILIFNIVYVPIYFIAIIICWPAVLYLFIYGGFLSLGSTWGVLTVFALFIGAIIFLILGVIREKKIPKDPPMETRS